MGERGIEVPASGMHGGRSEDRGGSERRGWAKERGSGRVGGAWVAEGAR